MKEQIVKTTLRIPESVHRTLKAACALSGENLSEFITRVAKSELEKLVTTNRDKLQHEAEKAMRSIPQSEINETPESAVKFAAGLLKAHRENITELN